MVIVRWDNSRRKMIAYLPKELDIHSNSLIYPRTQNMKHELNSFILGMYDSEEISQISVEVASSRQKSNY